METLESIAISALRNAHLIHQQLGESGEELVRKNNFGETALRVDIETEKAVIDTLRKAGVPIKVISEENGTVQIGNNPAYLGILDGLDGSDVYKNKRGTGRYGTMFGIFSGLNPAYGDYIFSGVMEHSARRLFFASKGNGSFVEEGGKKRPVRCSGRTVLDNSAIIYIDEKDDIHQRWYPLMKETFTNRLEGFNLRWLGSSSMYYVDLASGSADLVLECTRKGNLEIAIAYGLETESGGVMVTLDGRTLGDRKYLDFAQDRHVPVISASTRELASELIRHITRD